MEYTEVFSKLTYETAAVVFLKKNGDVRLMLCTRNLHTVDTITGEFKGMQLGGHDKRCGIDNGNIAVWDLIVNEARSFNINRVLSIQYAGQIETKEQYENVLEQFVKFKEEYEKTKPMKIDMNTFD